MKKMVIYTIVFMVSISCALWSETVKRRLELSLMPAYQKITDYSGSPMPYSGFVSPLMLTFFGQKERTLQSIDISLLFSGVNGMFLQSPATWEKDHTVNLRNLSISYSLLANLFPLKREQSLYIGGEIELEATYKTFQYDFVDQELWSFEDSWDGVISLNASSVYLIKVSENTEIRLHGSLNLLSYVMRPPFAVQGDQIFPTYVNPLELLKLGYLSYFPEMINGGIKISVVHEISRHLYMGGGGFVDYYRFSEPRESVLLLTGASFFAGWSF